MMTAMSSSRSSSSLRSSSSSSSSRSSRSSSLARAIACWLVAWVAVGGAACATEHRVVVTGSALYHTMGERRAKGTSQVPASDLSDDGERSTYAVVARGSSLELEEGRMSLAELERGCAGPASPGDRSVAPAADQAAAQAVAQAVARPAEDAGCSLTQYADTMFTVRRYDEHYVPVGKILGYTGLSLIGAAAVCEFACREDSTEKTASDVTLIAVGSLFLGTLVWAFFDCMGKWGQPGCRD